MADHHFVIRATRTEDGHTFKAMTYPETWDRAIAHWIRFNASRDLNMLAQSPTLAACGMFYMVRSVADPAYAHLLY